MKDGIEFSSGRDKNESEEIGGETSNQEKSRTEEVPAETAGGTHHQMNSVNTKGIVKSPGTDSILWHPRQDLRDLFWKKFLFATQ